MKKLPRRQRDRARWVNHVKRMHARKQRNDVATLFPSYQQFRATGKKYKDKGRVGISWGKIIEPVVEAVVDDVHRDQLLTGAW